MKEQSYIHNITVTESLYEWREKPDVRLGDLAHTERKQGLGKCGLLNWANICKFMKENTEQPWRANANVNYLNSSEKNIIWPQAAGSSKPGLVRQVLRLGVDFKEPGVEKQRRGNEGERSPVSWIALSESLPAHGWLDLTLLMSACHLMIQGTSLPSPPPSLSCHAVYASHRLTTMWTYYFHVFCLSAISGLGACWGQQSC